ncbi:EamA/RhaT family transporter [Helicobacter didelphidarum]|uniref:EamA/RhaT family transporter n=1 Tax=Helicobacter didelphidarum TaxID=2040648 RepID=A0A3D8IIW2_9HELI|nr:DMT family transporter [Helicobacter didelphidarum]RDU64885.1 EamA/RhaT family transporter [Helicobacter didelphidarum]
MRNSKDSTIFFIFIAILAECFIIYASVLVKVIDISPINLGFYRVVLALPCFFLAASLHRNMFTIPLRDILFMILAGVFFACDLLFFNYALHKTSVANVNLMVSMTCFVLIPIGVFVFHEKVKKYFFVGGIIAIIGVVMLIKGRGNESVATAYGDFLGFLSAVCYGLFLVVMYSLRRRYGTLETMTYACLGSSIVLFVLAYYIEGIEIPTNAHTWWQVILFAFCGQVIGQGFFNFILGKVNTQTSSLLLLCLPIIAALMGFFILNEKLGFFEICGILIIILGVYFAKKESY